MSAYPMTVEQISEKEREARELVKRKARFSSIAAALPIPFLDIGTDMKLMNDITGEIEEIFELDHKQVSGMSDDMMNRAAVMATSMGSEFVGRQTTKFLIKRIVKGPGRRAFRFVPVIGQAAGAFVSYMMMKKLGNDHIEKCAAAARQQTTV
ncbi:MAG TPA: hypothetical protein H9891_00990 [Candidatus Salinicoccus stercoripullorum]|uniref:DUF697 domain-containing protein n=1 Tax=Candidatus Salinicoccus stercoripullorum TaxID=2838756 RepID=A0A9D1QGE2_9STAP|nr:hypothetical protein [Candidatus Salinicoccus stercoripullorum]